MRTDDAVWADLDARFNFADGPVKIIDPRKVKTLAPPAERERPVESLTIGKQPPKDKAKRHRPFRQVK